MCMCLFHKCWCVCVQMCVCVQVRVCVSRGDVDICGVHRRVWWCPLHGVSCVARRVFCIFSVVRLVC